MMMSSVFSSFDPTMSIFSFSWFSFFFFLLFFPGVYWFSVGFKYIFLGFLGFLNLEAGSLVSYKKGLSFFMVTLMFTLCALNFLALFPFCFSLTSHLLITLPLSYGMWLGVIFFSVIFSLKGVLSHMVPSGTPMGLLSFMVVVEFLSNLIRPMALMFRLTANMMAGHLLLSLVGNFVVNLQFSFLMLGGVFQSLLVLMELGVSLIQAYVFSTLLILYISEMDH